MYMSPDNWLEIIRSEYLGRFIKAGGSAVKFAVLQDNISPTLITSKLMHSAADQNYVFASVNAEQCKVHMMEKLFFNIARQIEWDKLARGVLRELLSSNGYLYPEEDDESIQDGRLISLEALAELNDRIPRELLRDIKIWLEKAVYNRTDLILEFRIAVIRLCLCQLTRNSDPMGQHLHATIMDWLHGDLRRITLLKAAYIYRRINRDNARSMFLSLSVFTKMAGFAGLVLNLDISRYLLVTRPKIKEDKLFFTKAATMDMFEVLRQFIDGTDRQQHCLTVITAPLDLIQNEKRGIGIYTALRDRTIDDVRDRTHANPMAPLVRLAKNGNLVAKLPDAVQSIEDDNESVRYQRAIEALRCGVPNEDAVREMKSFQPGIHDRFELQLQQLKESPQEQSPGMLIAGGFGGGKSHLLQYLQYKGLKQNFVCSKVVISKETPLFDPYKLFTAAMRNMRLPGNHINEMAAIAQELDPGNSRFAKLEAWLKENSDSISDRFAATLFLYSQFKFDPELQNRIVRYWCGDKLLDSEIKRRLRQLGELQSYHFERIKKKELAMQRFRFAAQLMIAAGYDGWVVLLDEAELIGRYSLLQRSRSYGQMARLLGRVTDWSFNGMTTVIAITDDFQSAILDDKNDIEKVPNRLLARGTESDTYLAKIAEHCMGIIQKDRITLRQPDRVVVDSTYEELKNVYRRAYNWDPVDLEQGERLSSSPMRHFVKGWITGWDLKRYHPEHTVDITTEKVVTEYSEDRTFERSSKQEEFDTESS